MDRNEIMNFRVIDLKEKLRELGLPVIGRKQTLQDRLLEFYGHRIEVEESEEEDVENEAFHDVDNVSVRQNTDHVTRHERLFTLNDIRESLNYFDGVNKPDITAWLENFEENAEAVKWDELQKFLYAKQLIKGAAKTFLRGQTKINSWNKLRQSLVEEFGQQLSAIDIHKTLQSQRKKPNETCLEFLYSILELSAGMKMDDKSIIEYFIDGIPDSRINKIALYDAENISELKIKIKNYEKMKSKEDRNHTQKYRKQFPAQCSNCPHLKNHSTEECRKINNLCYKCGRKGHKAHECRSNVKYENPRQNDSNNRFQQNNSSNKYQQNNNRYERNNDYRFQQNNNSNRVPQNNNRSQPNNSNTRQDNNNQIYESRFGKVNNLYKNVTIRGRTFKALFDTGSEYGLQINWKKCQFVKKEITFLGYIIKDSSIAPSKEKIKAISKYPCPRDIKTLQQFLGLTSYFRRFISNYAIIARPLTNLLTKHSQFKIDSEQQIAFLQLKEALTNEPVLNIYNPYAETEVHTDASIHGYGATLMQKNSTDNAFHPVEYMSRKTNSYEEKYHSYDLEVLAIVAALKKWRTYLLGIHFKIVTDCVAFTQTVKKPDVPARITRWVIFLQDFDYEIEHRTGAKLKHVDALSRAYCYMMSRSLKHRIEQAQNTDIWIKSLKELVSKEKHPEYFIKNNLLFKNFEKELLVIPSSMETEIIEMAHRQGHFSAKRTMESIQNNFYIPELKTKTSQIIKNCVQCIIAEAKIGKKEGMLNPIEKSNQPFDTFHIDHVGPLENTHKQYNHILTIVDAFTKFTWLYPTKSTGTQEVINILERNSAVFGHPSRIVTDRGVAFTSNDFKDYCVTNNIVHVLITTGIPRANGQVERIHKIVISLLTKMCSENNQHWYKHLNTIQQTMNSTPPRSTRISPFKLMTGIDMNTAGITEISKIIQQELEQEIDDERTELRKVAKENISKIQNENRKNYNKKRKEGDDYQIGDVVAIKRTQFGVGLKIKPKFLGPYKVTRTKRNGRYEVEKLDEFEGPKKTTTITENMKPWTTAFGSNTASGRPNVGNKG